MSFAMKGFIVAFVVLWISALVEGATKCDANNKCPQESPCCSQYGECGSGLSCLGACDVRGSYNLTSCVAMPVCKSQKHKFSSTDEVVHQDDYLGDVDEHAWTTNGYVLAHNGELMLAMPRNSYGTVISSTRAVWFGKVSATLKTSHGNGVVSAFILMSGSKDEVDYEFVGNDLDNAQTNYYYQGVLNYTNGAKHRVSNTHENYHTYEIDWKQDRIVWSIDGETVRTLNREDTWNDTTKQFMFPQTPSIIQLSLWPGGSEVNKQGTVDWAGGKIDWNMAEFEDPGYLYVMIKEISVECYDVPGNTTQSSNAKSYIYTGGRLTETDVAISDSPHILKSSDANGFDMDRKEEGEASTTIDVSAVSTSIASTSVKSKGSSTKAASGSSSSSSSSSATATQSLDDGSQFHQEKIQEPNSAGKSTATFTSLLFLTLSWLV
ncbi:probable glycosidase CRH2 [Trichomonascus vanleenenianus]|uniref:putative glycosidase CRH2 n=1 Tax=Trichomonascus vanleenenianus TaxID=2268995 RepID=UPI003ECB0810